MFIMYVLYLSFLSQVSDPNYGGVYMTLLGTFANLSYAITRTGSLWLIDVLTFKQCSTIPHNYCETSISTEVNNIKTYYYFNFKTICIR
jgi:PAT family acetyl-CoA transporter-like MFS transporter 1